jgi:hypothetical protein
MGRAHLTYVVNQGMLFGTVGGEMVNIRTVSGGGGGAVDKKTRKPRKPDDPSSVNNPLKTGQKEDNKDGVRGGPIPDGSYLIETPFTHGPLGLSARLSPMKGNDMMGREGFFIHGRGPKGSDGCIVPLVPAEFHALMKGLEKDEGGTLRVHGISDDVDTRGFA